ncbi:MAG TPA: LamG domain-containing protein, partial [Chryseolinea sp.]|nr:LamG domain-containing protein [Chryseolinea sp.]
MRSKIATVFILITLSYHIAYAELFNLFLHCDGTNDSGIFSDETGKPITAHGSARIDTSQKKIGKGSVLLGKIADPMLHFNGVNGSIHFIDSANSGHSFTAGGTAHVDTAQSKFGGASLFLDGKSGCLSSADHSDWEFKDGDFTIDFWVRFNSVIEPQGIIGQWDKWNDQASWLISLQTSTSLAFYYTFDGITEKTASVFWTPSIKTWYHISVIRNQKDLKIFINGTQAGETYKIGKDAIFNSTSQLFIGAAQSGDITGSPLNFVNGWVDEVRILKGKAYYTSNFTTPSTPYVGDYLSAPDSPDWEFGSDNFTIDFWVRFAAFNQANIFLSHWDRNKGQFSWILFFNNDTKTIKFEYATSNTVIRAPAQKWHPTIGVWYHIVVVRDGGDLKIFVDSALVGSTYNIGKDTIIDSISL